MVLTVDKHVITHTFNNINRIAKINLSRTGMNAQKAAKSVKKIHFENKMALSLHKGTDRSLN